MLGDILASLRLPSKELACKYFYDRRGSQLFDRITELPEYYPTRTELAIMRRDIGEMAARIGAGACLIEYGSGSSTKTRLLLDALPDLRAYVPIDISGEHLEATAQDLRRQYPAVLIAPVCADYTEEFALPRSLDSLGRKTVYFPGSTIGNFHPADAVSFLRRMSRILDAGSGLLIGVDLKKDIAILEPAYNDAQGVTAAFNLNLLARLNRELGADFDLAAFRHVAEYDPQAGCIEMFLVSLREQEAHVGDAAISFERGERIRTECSYKYTLEEFDCLALRAGFTVEQVWTDPARLFSVQYLTVA